MNYPIGLGSQSKTAYGVRGIPAAFLIGPDGRLVWAGHPGGGDFSQLIPDLLAQQTAFNPGEFSEGVAKAAQYCRDGKLGKAYAEASRRVDSAPAAQGLLDALNDRMEALDAGVLALGEEGRYQEAYDRMEEYVKISGKHPMASTWSERMKSWKKDRSLKDAFKIDADRLKVEQMLLGGHKDRAKQQIRRLLKKAEGMAIEPFLKRLNSVARSWPG